MGRGHSQDNWPEITKGMSHTMLRVDYLFAYLGRKIGLMFFPIPFFEVSLENNKDSERLRKQIYSEDLLCLFLLYLWNLSWYIAKNLI